MRIKRVLKDLLNILVEKYDNEIVSTSILFDWQRSYQDKPAYNRLILPDGANSYLQMGNPKLIELQAAYSQVDKNVTDPLVWREGHVTPGDITSFRGDNAYVWQLRGPNMNITSYALTGYYVNAIDNLGLLNRLVEDEYFGNYTFLQNDKVLSRDLLDSIIEIYFLERYLHISKWKNLSILDIGAGYGRLAHRTVKAFSNIKDYLCADAVPISTFICEYYLNFRGLTKKAIAVPLHELENNLHIHEVDIAVNVHCFSECTLTAIEWWLNMLQRNRIRYLMIVPNSLDHGGKQLLTNNHQDFSNIIKNHGYQLITKEPKFRDKIVQNYGINPTYHYLFELH